MPLIRTATSFDREGIRVLYLQAFPEGENEIVAQLATDLLAEGSPPETITLVAECDGTVAGHAAFSPVTSDTDEEWIGYILAPLGVKPEYQKGGIGTKLVESGIARLLRLEANAVFVYGDPKYYEKFGFRAETASKFLPPYKLKYPFGWQAIALHEGDAKGQVIGLSFLSPLCDPALW